MNVKKLIILITFCVLVTGCSKKDSTDEQNQISPTELPAVTAAPFVYPVYDYSEHTEGDESSYVTNLVDLSKLKEGLPVFAQEELTLDGSSRTFEGFETKDALWGYDVRSCDISEEDLSVITDVNELNFDTNTIWPENLSDSFDPDEILEYNKNPGLGICSLHEQGITGDGVSIAIIDQALLLSHEQYKNNLMFYERIHCYDEMASMYGTGAVSIAVGKDIGVAPGAKLYYIASTFGHVNEGKYDYDDSIMADAILRVLEINENLPENEKIRVISIMGGYNSLDQGYEELAAALKKADEQNVFVITSASTGYYKGFSLMEMDRDYLDDPDEFTSYRPALWIADNDFGNSNRFKNSLCVPSGSRTVAESTGDDDYGIMRNGGGWVIPWCAGFYALCCQVKPDITPQEFIELVNSTAITTDIEHDGKPYHLEKIINPVGVIEDCTMRVNNTPSE